VIRAASPGGTPRARWNGIAVVTDPYTPGPKAGSGFDPIDEPAGLVIMSSSTDDFHSDPSHVRGDPIVIDALELPPEGTTVKGIHIRPFPAMESLTFDFQVQVHPASQDDEEIEIVRHEPVRRGIEDTEGPVEGSGTSPNWNTQIRPYMIESA
jgi:hypothetical protein